MKTNPVTYHMPMFMAIALLCVIGVRPSILRAQESTIFTYQGRLGDNGALANGAYDFKFSIYDSTNQPGVLIAGPRTNFTVAVSNGLFTTSLDFGVAPFDGSDRWLDIGVRTNGAGSFTALTTRQQITLTPYAIMSRSSLFAVSNFTVGAGLVLPPTTPTIYSGNQTLFRSDSFEENVFVGLGAGAGGTANTAVGNNALANGAGGGGNSAFGDGALLALTGGFDNTAIGSSTMGGSTNGNDNTALGAFALGGLANGGSNSYNTAEGFFALTSLTSGNENTANGFDALAGAINGSYNTADGSRTLSANTSGGYNVAVGYQALHSDTGGSSSTAVGASALYAYNGFGYNTALGVGALQSLTFGSDNIGIGSFSGQNLTTGSLNIDIGNSGAPGDDSTIKIGQQGTQSQTFIAGISGTTISGGAQVYVNSSGQLGAVSPAFVQTANAGNIQLRGTIINSALCNGKPNAILIVTPVNGLRDQIFVSYIGSQWEIIYTGQNMQAGDTFNVFVANP